MHIRARALSVCSVLLAALFLASTTGWSAQDKKDQKNQPKLTKEQQQEQSALVALVNQVAAGTTPAPADIPVTFHNHFMRSREGKAFMPFTLEIDPTAVPSGVVTIYIRADRKGGNAYQAPPSKGMVWVNPQSKIYYKETDPLAGKTTDGSWMSEDDAKKKGFKEGDSKQIGGVEHAWEDIFTVDLKAASATAAPPAGQPQATPASAAAKARVNRYIGVPAGEYDVYIAVREARPGAAASKDKNAAAPAPKTTVLKQTITAPDFNNGLAVSSIIVVEKVEDLPAPLPESQLRDNPYTFGSMKLTPSLTNKFTKKDEISWIFVVYNATLDPTSKKPDVTIEYSFYQKTKDGEKYFNKTSPQNFNAQTLPPAWDAATANQISAGQSVPLASFPEGDYRLEVKVTDKLGNKTITENVPFTVVAGS